MKKITKLDDYQPVEIMKDTFESKDMVLRGVVEKTNELVDFANSHQEEHEGLLDAIKTVYAPEIEGKIFSSGRGTDQPKETKECKHEFDLNISPYCKLCGIEFASKYKPKADKIAELIKDYAHDYRDMELDEPHFGAMLKEFLEVIETL